VIAPVHRVSWNIMASSNPNRLSMIHGDFSPFQLMPWWECHSYRCLDWARILQQFQEINPWGINYSPIMRAIYLRPGMESSDVDYYRIKFLSRNDIRMHTQRHGWCLGSNVKLLSCDFQDEPCWYFLILENLQDELTLPPHPPLSIF